MRTMSSMLPLLAAGLAAMSAAPAASAQLIPDRMYYGVNRAIPMTAETPAETPESVAIRLLEPGPSGSADAAVVEETEIEPGRVDLAGLFPILWTADAPSLLYAQLVVGEQPLGPAVVLQPMLTPRRAQASGRAIQFSPDRGRIYSGLRAYTDRHVVFQTSEGEIEIALRPDHAPNTAMNLIHLVEGGYYTDIVIHRIVPALPDGSPFVAQFGDPTGAGAGGPGYFFDLEPSTLPHDFGVISMARSNDPDSNGSQVFLCLSRQGTARLDGLYTAFGQLVRGAEALIRIEQHALAAEENETSDDPPVVRRARTVPAPPYGHGPRPANRPPDDDGAR